MTVQRAHRAFRRKRSPRADPEFVPKVDIPADFVNTRPVSTVRTGPRVPAASVPSLSGMPPPPQHSPELTASTQSLSERLAERISVPMVAVEPENVVEQVQANIDRAVKETRDAIDADIARDMAETTARFAESYPTMEEIEAAHLAKQKAEHDA